MKLILLSGGSGKRLWPLSNDVRSKQFLKLLKDESGNQQSMVQRVYGQIMSTHPEADILIATNAAQVDSIRGQMGDSVDIVVEPERRDTFPAIVLACAYLALEKHVDPDETIAVLPVDPYTESSFFLTLFRADAALRDNLADIVLIGIRPTVPTSKYGYIVPGEEISEDIFSVSRYVEKPNSQKAALLINEGSFWNGGVFSFKLGYLMSIARSAINFSTFSELRERYVELKRISFDYEVVEKAERLAMVPFRGMWSDIGTWRTLTDEMPESSIGHAITEDTKNTYIINELSVPLIALGTKDLIVAASPDGILVSDLVSSSHLKPVVDKLADSRPMYEERRWGEYTVLEKHEYQGGNGSLTKHILLYAGKEISYQSHKCRDEIWVITNGEGEFALEGKIQHVKIGDVLIIGRSQKHSIRAITDLHFTEVQIGNALIENDIEKYEWNWDETGCSK